MLLKSILIAKTPRAQRKINLGIVVLVFSCVIGSVVIDVFGEQDGLFNGVVTEL
ncbi:MAG: hypothetical protein NTV50_07450 [Planctomycetota bacterium]|nr:hypothetical protein [Planctomycetota bacterium]